MTTAIICPHCKECKLHEVYFDNNKSGVRCFKCDLVIRHNTETLKYERVPP